MKSTHLSLLTTELEDLLDVLENEVYVGVARQGGYRVHFALLRSSQSYCNSGGRSLDSICETQIPFTHPSTPSTPSTTHQQRQQEGEGKDQIIRTKNQSDSIVDSSIGIDNQVSHCCFKLPFTQTWTLYSLFRSVEAMFLPQCRLQSTSNESFLLLFLLLLLLLFLSLLVRFQQAEHMM